MLTVTDIMTTDVCTIRSSAKVTQAIALMQAKHVRSLIVEQAVQGGAYGIVTERDIVYKVMAKSADPLHVMVCEIMEHNCIAIDSTLGLLDVAKRFAEANIHRAPVVDNGQLVGVISITDIIMKSNVEAIDLPRDWAQKVQVALRHKRLCWGEACELEQESEVAREVLEKLHTEVVQ